MAFPRSAVMAFHFNLFFLPQAGLSTIVPLVNRAYLAVDLFFLLSGFVMAHVYGRELAANRKAHWRRFALARFARLYPLFAIATAALVALVALCHAPEDEFPFSGRSLALEALMLQQWGSGLSWDYPSWSISTEAEAYTFFIFFAGILLAGKCPRLMIICCILVRWWYLAFAAAETSIILLGVWRAASNTRWILSRRSRLSILFVSN